MDYDSGSAEQQLRADFDAATSQFCIGDIEDTDPYKIFCLGVTMCTLTLKGYVENPALWPTGAKSAEQAVEAYYETARRAIHAD